MYFQLKNRNANISQHLQTIFVLVKLLFGLGVQWSFGIVAHFYPENVFIRCIFIVTASLHGVFILLSTLSQKVVRRKFAGVAVGSYQRARSVFLTHTVNNIAGPQGSDDAGTA